jgi:Mg2+ and Co2+ transporter CorA
MTDDAPAAPSRGSVIKPSTSVVATVAHADGVRRLATPGDLRGLLDSGKLRWIDIAGSDAADRAAHLGEAGLGEADLAWAQRFGQTGRLMVGPQWLRAVTWVADRAGDTSEIHLLWAENLIVTVWDGDARILDEIRNNFAERASGLEKSQYQAVGVVLQLLLGTLDLAISELDVQLQHYQAQLDANPRSIYFSKVAARIQQLQSAWSHIDRYTSAARSAMVGVEALPGIDDRGAAELNDYADQVEDVAHRLQERNQWASQIVQDYATTLAKRQGEQINRLTLVSIIFLPLTFLTGFFGMNFNWMIDCLSSPLAFLGLGILLPSASVIAIVVWFRRKGLI